jgi:hypothetical protein
MRRTQSAPDGPLTPPAQQIDLEGRLHDLPPQSEVMRLFDYKSQLPGQTWLELEQRVE